jgi:hypothetical protein
VNLREFIARFDPPPDYLVLVNRAWKRIGDAADYDIFPVQVTEMLPCIHVPLRQGQDDVPLDLQDVFNHAYDSGPYRRGAVDYSQPPVPPRPAELQHWAELLLSPKQ